MEQSWIPGAATWISDPKNAWVAAKIKSVDKDHVHCVVAQQENDDSATEEQKEDDWATEQVVCAIPLENTASNEGGFPENRHDVRSDKMIARYMLPRDANCSVVDNMDNLLHLHEAAVLDNLRRRFEQCNIYTSTGPILIALNPFKQLDLFSQEHLALYQTMGECNAQTLPDAQYKPHCYKVAQLALDHMRRTLKDQSLIICGESGAGKTVTTKKMLSYLTRSGNADTEHESQARGIHRIESRIMESNPITEAFGNAKTVCNDNSSRFGKFIKLVFGSKGQITGGTISSYLLEKSRVVHQPTSERNYHCFYQLLAGANEDLRKRLHLPPPPNKSSSHKGFTFRYAAQVGSNARVANVDDAEELKSTVNAMKVVGMSTAEIEDVCVVLASILHLGQISFTENSDGHGVLDPGTMTSSERFCSLVGVGMGTDTQVLVDALSKKVIVSPHGEVFSSPVDAIQASASRDALAKSIYENLFAWLIFRINHCIMPGQVGTTEGSMNEQKRADPQGKKSIKSTFIGILDIFGFEVLAKCGLEQLFINLANERLQSVFLSHVFTLEQQQYRQEGIPLEAVDFPDNQDCLDLFEKSPSGLLLQLEEECMLGKGNDDNLARKMCREHNKHPRFQECTPQLKRKYGQRAAFAIQHYAGVVVYTTDEFVAKNKDTLFSSCIELMQSSSMSFIQTLFKQEEEEEKEEQQQEQQVQVGSRRRASSKRTSLHQTVSARFRSQLTDLETSIRQTEPHFVRCIKSNNDKRAGEFDAASVLRQLRNAGVLAALKVRRSGFPNRLLFDEFLRRYKHLTRVHTTTQTSSNTSNSSGDSKQACKALIQAFSSTEALNGGMLLGNTKVFMKSEAVHFLDSLQLSLLVRRAVNIQSAFRSQYQRAKFAQMKRAAVDLERIMRGTMERQRLVIFIRQIKVKTRLKQKFLRQQRLVAMLSDTSDNVEQEVCTLCGQLSALREMRDHVDRSVANTNAELGHKCNNVELILEHLLLEAQSLPKVVAAYAPFVGIGDDAPESDSELLSDAAIADLQERGDGVITLLSSVREQTAQLQEAMKKETQRRLERFKMTVMKEMGNQARELLEMAKEESRQRLVEADRMRLEIQRQILSRKAMEAEEMAMRRYAAEIKRLVNETESRERRLMEKEEKRQRRFEREVQRQHEAAMVIELRKQLAREVEELTAMRQEERLQLFVQEQKKLVARAQQEQAKRDLVAREARENDVMQREEVQQRQTAHLLKRRWMQSLIKHRKHEMRREKMEERLMAREELLQRNCEAERELFEESEHQANRERLQTLSEDILSRCVTLSDELPTRTMALNEYEQETKMQETEERVEFVSTVRAAGLRAEYNIRELLSTLQGTVIDGERVLSHNNEDSDTRVESEEGVRQKEMIVCDMCSATASKSRTSSLKGKELILQAPWEPPQVTRVEKDRCVQGDDFRWGTSEVARQRSERQPTTSSLCFDLDNIQGQIKSRFGGARSSLALPSQRTIDTDRDTSTRKTILNPHSEIDSLEAVRGDIPDTVYQRCRAWRSNDESNNFGNSNGTMTNDNGYIAGGNGFTTVVGGGIIKSAEDELLARIHRACASMELHGEFSLARD